MDDSDRRTMIRFSMALPASVRELSSGVVKESRTRDISSQGAYMVTRKPVGVGSLVSIALGLVSPDRSRETWRGHTWVDVKGVVIRTDPGGMAICFTPKYRIHGKEN